MKQSHIEKYFKQKEFSLIDIICFVIALMALIVSTFVWGGLPIGMPIFILSVAVLIISRSSRIKDGEIDGVVDNFAEQNAIDKSEKNIIAAFDLKAEYKMLGKDGKPRSSVYTISSFEFCEELLKIKVYKLNLVTEEMTMSVYSVIDRSKISLVEEDVKVGGKSKNVKYLVCADFEDMIPIHTNDVNAEKLIEKICK